MTKNKINFKQLNKYFFVILIISGIILLVVFPSLSMRTFYEGLIIWATKVLPALLPFFILTKLLSYTQFISNFGRFISPLTQKVYGVGGVAGYIYIMSIISGYPVGAKLTSDLYSNKTISKKQAFSITAFTSTSGPLFILGTVSIGLFKSDVLGIIIICSHYIGALINGLIYRQKKENVTFTLSTQIPENFLSESMSSSILSIMTVGGFIALFYMFLNLLLSLHVFDPIISLFSNIGIDRNLTTSIICGLIEVTTGAIYLSKLSLNFQILAPILTFLISFGGLSIHAQAYCFLKNFEMPYRLFFLQKLTQALISTIISIALVFIF